jgi:hypothetical protein
MVVGIGSSIRSDDDVLVRSQPVIVNIVYAADVAIEQGLLADVVINYKDLLSGKYKAKETQVVRQATTPLAAGVEKVIEPEPRETTESEDEDEVDLEGDPGVEEIEEPSEDVAAVENDDFEAGERINAENINFNL